MGSWERVNSTAYLRGPQLIRGCFKGTVGVCKTSYCLKEGTETGKGGWGMEVVWRCSITG